MAVSPRRHLAKWKRFVDCRRQQLYQHPGSGTNLHPGFKDSARLLPEIVNTPTALQIMKQRLVFAAPLSAEVKREAPAATRPLQSKGRTRRPFPGKQRAHVFDIIDTHPFGLSAGRKHGEIYRQQGFEVRYVKHLRHLQLVCTNPESQFADYFWSKSFKMLSTII